MSHLSADEVAKFFGILLPLLGYVNKKAKLYSEPDTMTAGQEMVPKIVGKIAEKLWAEVSLIDEYLAENAGLAEAEKDILRSWKRAKTDNFICERQLREGAVFINQAREVYIVKGISHSFDVMFGGRPLPLALTATLLPFRDAVITDGLIRLMNISYGKNMKREFRDIYNAAAKENRLIRRL